MKEINKLNAHYAKSYEEAIQSVTEALRNEQIHLVDNEQLDEAQQRFVHDFYYERLNGQLQPIWLSEIKQIDSETDEDIYLAIKMRQAENKKEAAYAILALPVALAGRFVRLPDKDIVCVSTGNFHEGNARMYTDCILMTANPQLTHEVAAVFNFIERPYTPVRFKELLVSPN